MVHSARRWSRIGPGAVHRTWTSTSPGHSAGSEALAAGRITRGALRGPRFRKLGPDTYVSAAVPDDPRLAVHAASVRAGADAVVTGWSACLWWGCDVLPWPPPPVELAAPDQRLRPAPGLWVCRSRIRDDDVVMEDGVRVTTTLRTAYDLAARCDLDTGVVAADGLAHLGRFSSADLLSLAEDLGPRRGCRRIDEVAALMDPKAESPQETRVRLRLLRARLPAPGDPARGVRGVAVRGAGRLRLAGAEVASSTTAGTPPRTTAAASTSTGSTISAVSAGP